MMSGAPGGPNPSVPQIAQVDGRNCMGPSAPALDGPSLAPSPLSISPIAASTVQDRPGQYRAAEALNRSIQLAGTPVGAFTSTGRLPAAFRVYATRFTTWPPLPMITSTCAFSEARLSRGALIRTAKFLASPSCADRVRFTIASAPGTLSSLGLPNGTCSRVAAETGYDRPAVR